MIIVLLLFCIHVLRILVHLIIIIFYKNIFKRQSYYSFIIIKVEEHHNLKEFLIKYKEVSINLAIMVFSLHLSIANFDNTSIIIRDTNHF